MPLPDTLLKITPEKEPPALPSTPGQASHLEKVDRSVNALSGSTQADLLSSVDAKTEAQRAAENKRQELMYGISLSESDYGLIRDGILNSKNPDEERWNWGSALMYSQRLGIPVATAKQNLDSISSAWLANPAHSNGKSNYEAIVDSFHVGDLSMDAAKLAKQWKDSGGQDQNLERKIDAIYGEMSKMQDRWPRGVLTTALKFGAESAPFMAQVAGKGLMAGMAATAAVGVGTAMMGGTAATFGLAAPLGAAAMASALTVAASQVGSFMASMQIMEALDYYDMRKKGVSHEIANPMAALSGGVQATLESVLGNVPGLIGKVGGKSITGISGNIAKGLLISGKTGALATALMEYGGELLEEGAEEALQSISSDVIKNIAMGLEGGGLEQIEASEIATNAWENFKGGALASLGYGLPGAFIGYKGAARQSKALKEYAGMTDRETFIEQAGKWKDVESVPEAQRKAALGKIWEQAQQKAKEARQAAPQGEQKPITRTESGDLYTEETTVSSAEEDKVEAILKVGDAETKERYGYLRYEVTEDGIVLKSAPFKKGFESARDEAILDLAAKYPGLPITVSEGATDATRAAVERLTAANPKGTGANWYSEGEDKNVAQARAKLRLAISDKMPNVSAAQREAAILIHEFRANAMGVKFDDYLKNEFSSEIIGTNMDRVSAAQGQRAGILFTKDGQELKIGEFVRDAKALVMVTEKSDFVSFVHESGHLFRKQLIGTDLGKNLDDAYQIVGGQWTREYEERFVDDLVKYLSYGEVKDEKLRGVFAKIAEWITRMWDKVLKQSDVDPRIRAVMDELFKSDVSPLQEASRTSAIASDGGTSEGASAVEQGGKDEVLFQGEAKSTLSTSSSIENTQETSEKYFYGKPGDIKLVPVSEKIWAVKKVKSGKILPEFDDSIKYEGKQAVLFETAAPTDSEAFKKWFGDSKIIDDAGKPLVVYRGGRAIIEAFDKSKIGTRDPGWSGRGFYFSTSKTGAESYGPNVLSAYLSISNPYRMYSTDEFIGNQSKVERFTDALIAQGYDGVIAYGRSNEKNESGELVPIGFKNNMIDEIVAFEPTQIKLVNNRGTWDPEDPRILFQSEDGSLVVLHNIDSDRIATVEEFGGLPMPSLAVTRPNIDFTQFGDATLIADPSVAQMALESNELYDRDIWSPTVPAPDWKVNNKFLDKWDEKWRAAGKVVGEYVGLQSLLNSDIKGGASRLANKVERYQATMYMYLAEKGTPVEPVYTSMAPDWNVPLEIGLAVKVFTDAHLDYVEDYVSEHYDALVKTIKSATKAYYQVKDRGLVKRLQERFTGVNNIQSLVKFAQEYDESKKVIDNSATGYALRSAIEPQEDEYRGWIRKSLAGGYSNPTIKVSGKKVSYNAKSVLDWMRSQNTMASQKTMSYGPAKAASMAGMNFGTREELREKESALVSSEESAKIYEETIEPLVKELQEKLPQYYRYDDTWGALDSIFKAVGKYLYGGTKKRSPERMVKALYAESFAKVPDELIDKAVSMAHYMADKAQDYYEVKPSRVLHLSDFKAAVVPLGTNPASIEVLEASGVKIYEYGDKKTRPDVVRHAIFENQNILFQLDDEAIDAEAKKFDSWQEWKADEEATAEWITEQARPGDLDGKELDDWYRTRWEAAHEAVEKEKTEAKVKERKDARRGEFAAQMAKEGGVEALLAAIWDAEVQAFDVGQAMDEEEQAQIEKAGDWKNDLAHRLADHPLVLLSAQSVGNGKKIKATTRKAILTYIRNNEIEFAALYAELTGDLDLAQYAEAGRTKLQSIPDPKLEGYDDMSIAERTALLNRISDKEVKDRIKSGEYDDPYLEDYARRLEETKKELTKEAEDAKSEIEKLGGELASETEFAMKMYDRAKTTGKALESKEAELEKAKAAKERVESAKSAYVEALGSARDESKLSVKIAKKELVAALNEARKEAAFQARFVAAEIRATTKLREQRDSLRRHILKKPSKNIIYAKRQQILTIQEYLRSKKWEYVEDEDEEGKPHRRRAYDTVVGDDGKKHKVPRYTTVQAENLHAALSMLLRETPGLAKILTNDIVDRINAKPVTAWTVSELQDLREIIDRLAKEGREEYDMKRMMENRESASDRYDIEHTLRKNKRYKDPAAHGSDEAKAIRKKMEGFATWELPVMKMRYFAPLLDGGTEGVNTKVLVEDEYQARREKQAQKVRRLNKVHTRMRELNMSQKERQRKITIAGIGPGGTDVTMSAARLSHVALLIKNEKGRAAYIYGNLFSEYERTKTTRDFLKANGDAKYNKLVSAIDLNLTAGEKEIIDMIGTGFGGAEFDRMNKAVIELTNEEMKPEANYSPLYREGAYFESQKDSILDAMKAQHGFVVNPESGFTISRIKIAPEHQSPVRVMDIVAMFEDAVETQEHLIAYGAYVKKLHAVYQNQQLSKSVREGIIQTFGKDGMEYVDKYIGTIANPEADSGSHVPGDKALRRLRGFQAVGFLAYRWTSVVKQLITSPLPYMAYAPKETLASAFQAIGSGNMLRFIAEVEAKSSMLQSRTIDQIFQAIKTMDSDGWEGIVKQIGTVGMKGLEYADRISVAIGWKGVYDKELSSGATEEQAIKKADDITFQTQPSANPADLAPIYRDMNEWKRILLMFTSSLNTVYNNIRHGVPKAIREKHYGQAVGIVTSYAIAGVLLGALAKSIGKDPPPDDLDEWWRQWVYYSMTQFTDSVPVFGNEFSGVMKRMVTKSKGTPFGEDTLPTVTVIIKGFGSLNKGDIDKAAENFAEGVGLATGFPTLAIKNAIKGIGAVIEGAEE